MGGRDEEVLKAVKLLKENSFAYLQSHPGDAAFSKIHTDIVWLSSVFENLVVKTKKPGYMKSE